MIRRLFDPKRIQQILDFGKAWHERSVVREFKYSRKRAELLIKGALMSPEQAVWICEDQGKIQGLLIGAICAYPYCEAEYATDLVFVADKGGAQMFYLFEAWAKTHGANALQMGVSSGLSGAGAFYQAAGLYQVGGIFYKRL